MVQRSLEMIELEMAILMRRTSSITSSFKKIDRSTYLLLHQLSTDGSLGVKVLAKKLQLDISTVSRQTDTMEKKGYIRKIRDEADGRSYFYQITDLGIAELTAYKKVRLDRFTEILTDWSDDDCQKFGQLLEKFNETLFNE